ncbi:hypothetical protein DFJ43DRAFT_438028 [Lentinula guzmanii]|uniref:Protein kinase domain-containing protein n=1 Tax=Lentinula guzmanii TaxID=2804957 RepID=A0AA38JHA1_9AGAR|nr:hypothetical protein DFJ43DRAFT_438028 [Lentinula guzmanii]
MEPLSSNDNTTDVFSFQDDEELSNRLQFIKEIGCGNWGSVWLCELKDEDRVQKRPLATKLVHRNKESKTSAARVKSLWNEMKIIRRLKSDPHPSIIKFESFLLTPSYAIITMAYHPDLVTVQVSESHARVWFKHLLSAVQFLHSRGIVHNDIKPANILLSAKGIPVLCDFGFAEAYDLNSSAAFHSRFAYGTPEYLAPERARGIPHDTRKSDIWSLGVSFFEILVGRTPFENSDTDQCVTEEDLQKYWGRTLRGKWVGVWKMSKGMERLLKRMLSPNADLRCTADEAIKDIYWAQMQHAHHVNDHRRSSSYASSIVFEKDWAKFSESKQKTQASPLATHKTSTHKEDVKARDDIDVPKLHSPPGLESPRNHVSQTLAKSKSQGKMVANTAEGSKNVPRKRIAARADLSPIKASPPASPQLQIRKNIASHNGTNTRPPQRVPFGVLQTRNVENLPAAPQRRLAGKNSVQDLTKRHSKVGMLDELVNGPVGARRVQNKGWKGKENHVNQRVRDWEREKERLREISRLEEIERERDAVQSDSSITDEPEVVDITPELEQVGALEKVVAANIQVQDKVNENGVSLTPATAGSWSPSSDLMNVSSGRTVPVFSEPSTPPPTLYTTFLPEVVVSPTSPHKSSQPLAESKRPNSSSGRATFRHAIKRSIDKTFQMYKTSSLTGRSYHSRNLSVDQNTDAESRGTHSERESWEDEECVRAVKSSLPVVKHAVHNEQVAAENRVDRMTLWMRNVEQVVEDARQNFSSGKEAPLPPLPLPPANKSNLSASQARSNRSSRLPRRILAANQIFSESGDQSAEMSSFVTSVYASPDTSISTGNLGNANAAPDLPVPQLQTPSRQRRATVSTRSPDPVVSGHIDSSFDIDHGSPSKRKEKSKSHGNLFQLHIAPAAALGAELDKPSSPSFGMPQSARLSAMVDREVFIAPPVRSSENLGRSTSTSPSSQPNDDNSCDDLTSSPLRVEPYAPRPNTSSQPVPDTPTQKRVEGVYDRFLMATSGVKRLGKGYQSDNAGPVHNTISHHTKQSHRAFYTARKPLQMPPAVASDDQGQALTVDELGIIGYSTAEGSAGVTVLKDENNGTVALVRRAFKAIVPGKTMNRRLSRLN